MPALERLADHPLVAEGGKRDFVALGINADLLHLNSADIQPVPPILVTPTRFPLRSAAVLISGRTTSSLCTRLAKAAIILMSSPATAAPKVAVPPVKPKWTSPVLSDAIKVGEPGNKNRLRVDAVLCKKASVLRGPKGRHHRTHGGVADDDLGARLGGGGGR